MTTSQRAIEWAITHQQGLMIAASVLVAVLIGVAVVSANNAANRRQANEELGNALVAFRAGNFPDAATQLRGVADTWSSNVVGKIARLYAVDAQLEAGNPDLAVTDLTALLADPPPAEYLQQQARLNLGSALEAKQDLAAAGDNYAEAAAMSGPYRALALLREARVREQLGDKKRAEEVYETFVRDFPSAPEIEVVEARLRSL